MKKKKQPPMSSAELCTLIEKILDDKKAEEVVTLNLVGKTSITDYMVIASGQSSRQVGAMAEALQVELKAHGIRTVIEGMPQCDWVLVDAFELSFTFSVQKSGHSTIWKKCGVLSWAKHSLHKR